jgi:hypothetical protein
MSMKKLLFTCGLPLAGVIATLFVTNYGSPLTKAIVSYVNPPTVVASVNAQKIINSLEDGAGWKISEDGMTLRHEASAWEIRANTSETTGRVRLLVRYTLPSSVQPRFNGSDESLILAAYQKRVEKIEQAAMDLHLSGLTPVNSVPNIVRQLRNAPALPAQPVEQIPPPRGEEP